MSTIYYLIYIMATQATFNWGWLILAILFDVIVGVRYD